LLLINIKNKLINNENFYFRALKFSILFFLILRFFSSFVLLIGIIQPSPVAPYSEITREILNNLENQNLFTKYFLAPWYRWDTTHYLEIADFGYGFDPINTVWPPLYPFLIKAITPVFNSSLMAGFVVSNLFFIISLFLIYILTNELINEEISKRTLLYIVTFPTAFFFIAAYSESLFLALSLGVFLLINRKKWIWAGILSALATITRVQGIILVIPILIELIIEFRRDKKLQKLLTNSISCFYAPLAYLIYSLYVFFGLKFDWPWKTLSTHWLQHFGLPWDGFYFTLLSIFGKNELIDYTPTLVKILNITVPIITIYFLFRLRKKLPLSMIIYSWIMLFLAIGKIDYNNTFVSTSRYLLTIFPIFIGFAVYLNNKKLELMYFSVNIVIQTVLLVLFYWWVWVA